MVSFKSVYDGNMGESEAPVIVPDITPVVTPMVEVTSPESTITPEIVDLPTDQEIEESWDRFNSPTSGLIGLHPDIAQPAESFMQDMTDWTAGEQIDRKVTKTITDEEGNETERVISGSDMLKQTIEYGKRLADAGVDGAQESYDVLRRSTAVHYTDRVGNNHVVTLDEWDNIPDKDGLKPEFVLHGKEENPAESRKEEIITEMGAYTGSMQSFIEADAQGVQFCKTETQQKYIVAQIKRYYPELANGDEITDEMLLRMYHRDNFRELFNIDQLIAEQEGKKESEQNSRLLEALRVQAARLNGEQELLEGLDELKHLDMISLTDATRGLFKDREESSRFRDMREYVRNNSEKLQEYREIFERNVRKEKIKGLAVNSALMIGLIAFLVGSQMLSGEGEQG